MNEIATRNRFLTDAPAAQGAEAMALPLDDTAKEPLVATAPPPAAAPASGAVIEPGRALALSDFDPPETSAGLRNGAASVAPEMPRR